MALIYLAHHCANVCHLDRPRGSVATEGEWRDPDSFLHYHTDAGSFYQDSVLEAQYHGQSVALAAWGERLVSAWQRRHRRDFSTMPSVASAPSFSARNDRVRSVSQVY